MDLISIFLAGLGEIYYDIDIRQCNVIEDLIMLQVQVRGYLPPDDLPAILVSLTKVNNPFCTLHHSTNKSLSEAALNVIFGNNRK